MVATARADLGAVDEKGGGAAARRRGEPVPAGRERRQVEARVHEALATGPPMTRSSHGSEARGDSDGVIISWR
jgi:hypothetical protein